MVASSKRFGKSSEPEYSFYPVNPPSSDKGKGLGKRDSSDYDIKLVKSTLPYQDSSFILFLPPNYSPTIMGFYTHGKLRFVDADGRHYTNIEELITAKYGSKEQ